ncbi:MAG: bifunctional riboflavin kinase/FAD synthetase [Firmicutes bacterium]|nr:bifunctional riboflavin kinase/FAD synthetase [Bacillota bacterium]
MESIFPKDKNKIDTSKGTGVALGNFDGLHRGHMALIHKVIAMSKDKGLKSMVCTFSNHPENVIKGKVITPLIMSNEMKKKTLQKSELDYLYFENFDERLMKMSAEDFVKHILVQSFNVKLAVVGFHYHFGYKGTGDAESLKVLGKKYGFEVQVVDPVKLEGTIVSSTMIRKLIGMGDMQKASLFMGRAYAVGGKVVKGKKLGREIGFPTMNLIAEDVMLLPSNGVYLTETVINNRCYHSITNVGRNPTVGDKETRIETHVLNFREDSYDQEVEVRFIKKMRDEKKFADVQELARQISLDVQYANEYFGKSIYNSTNIC